MSPFNNCFRYIQLFISSLIDRVEKLDTFKTKSMMMKGMIKQQFRTKNENKLYFCRLCGVVTTSYEELEIHYALSHEDLDDRIYEFETEFITKNTKKQKKKDLKEKAIEELKLLIEGKHYHNEYVGWCETRYDLRTENICNKYIIDLVPRITIC